MESCKKLLIENSSDAWRHPKEGEVKPRLNGGKLLPKKANLFRGRLGTKRIIGFFSDANSRPDRAADHGKNLTVNDQLRAGRRMPDHEQRLELGRAFGDQLIGQPKSGGDQAVGLADRLLRRPGQLSVEQQWKDCKGRDKAKSGRSHCVGTFAENKKKKPQGRMSSSLPFERSVVGDSFFVTCFLQNRIAQPICAPSLDGVLPAPMVCSSFLYALPSQ